MKAIFAATVLIFLSLWIVTLVVVTGELRIPGIALNLPRSYAELGDAMGLLNGLFSSIAVIIAIFTLINQSREHQRARCEQDRQIAAIQKQQEAQSIANRIGALAARQSYLVSEIARMDRALDHLREEGEHGSDKWNNFDRRRGRCVEQCRKIDDQMNDLFEMEPAVTGGPGP